jgi:hypothetical protein
MSELKALPVVKNKFWIVEDRDQKVATIQTVDDGVVWVDGSKREKFASIKLLKDRHKVDFVKATSTKNDPRDEVHGFPVNGAHYNDLWDVSRRLPLFTRKPRSRSFYCAGYYIIQHGAAWIREFCPKLITLQRYTYLGPFHDEEQQKQAMANQRHTNG